MIVGLLGRFMVRRTLPLAVSASLLAACGGGGAKVDEGPPVDRRLEQANQAGTRALALQQPAEAVKQYRNALARAYERDDATAIGDVGYNLAVAQLKLGTTEEALRTVQEIRAELERRRVSPPAELLLVQAAAAYRTGAADEALAAVQQVLASSPLDTDTSARAWYIRGAVAADRSDAAGLAQAIAAIPATSQPDHEADRLELSGRAALLSGAPGQAEGFFEKATDQRRLALDYRGMTRALAFSAEAVLKLGRTGEAAVFYLRAGRSALLQGDARSARTMLDRADELARQSGATSVTAEVERVRKAAAATPPKS